MMDAVHDCIDTSLLPTDMHPRINCWITGRKCHVAYVEFEIVLCLMCVESEKKRRKGRGRENDKRDTVREEELKGNEIPDDTSTLHIIVVVSVAPA